MGFYTQKYVKIVIAGMEMSKKGFLKHADFLFLDALVLLLSYYIASGFRNVGVLGDRVYRTLIVLELLTFIAVVYFYEPYKSILRKKFTSLLLRSCAFSVIQLVMVIFLLFVTKMGTSISRIFLCLQYVVFVCISFPVKIAWRKVLRAKAKISVDSGSRSLLIVSSTKDVGKLKNSIERYNFDFFRVIGVCLVDRDKLGAYKGLELVCTKDGLLSYCCNNWVDSVFFDMDYHDIPDEILNGLALAGITTHLRLMKVEAFEGQDQRVEKLLNYPVLTSMVKERSSFDNFAKRAMDIAGGIVGCMFMIIIAIIIGPIIYMKSPGPIFYKQERIGQNGRHFYMYKFRSMVMNADALKKGLMAQNRVKDGMMFKIKNDPRIIPGIGNFIRKTSLDEFPQFINVLKGDMSLVGTRPPTVDEWNKYELQHRIRMAIKPGITGMWQVSGRNEITDFNEVIKLDSYYINNWSLALDISILVKTVISLFNRGDNEAM